MDVLASKPLAQNMLSSRNDAGTPNAAAQSDLDMPRRKLALQQGCQMRTRSPTPTPTKKIWKRLQLGRARPHKQSYQSDQIGNKLRHLGEFLTIDVTINLTV
jgi:hypothetical protein